MSFIDDIIGVGKSVVGFFTGNSVLSSIAKTAIAGFALSKVSSSVNKQNNVSSTANSSAPDPGVRLQVNPNPEHKIPVVYGNAFLGGIITDARIAESNTVMYYVITIAEKTGPLLSTGLASQTKFENVYWNDQRVIFNEDGITAAYTIDRDNNVDYSIAGLVTVYFFDGNSGSQIMPDNYFSLTRVNAAQIVPGWTPNHDMEDLVFAVVKVRYNKEKNVTSIPNLIWNINNSLTLPGDCLYDYMTNTRYGAGIDPTEIYSG